VLRGACRLGEQGEVLGGRLHARLQPGHGRVQRVTGQVEEVRVVVFQGELAVRIRFQQCHLPNTPLAGDAPVSYSDSYDESWRFS
jgi:hypothetical protein